MHILSKIGLTALGLAVAASSAFAYDAGDREAKRYRAKHARTYHGERLTADQREYERARAENYDPGGSYRDYPDWARYALSPKGGNR